jgi:hypothetical protein
MAAFAMGVGQHRTGRGQRNSSNPVPTMPPAVRLDLRLVSGLKTASAERIVAARRQAPFYSADDLARRAALDQQDMTLLATSNDSSWPAPMRSEVSPVTGASRSGRLPP